MIDQIESSISKLFIQTEVAASLEDYREEEWLILARKIGSENQLTLKTDVIAAILYWLYSGKPEYEFTESSATSKTISFSKETTRFASGHQASFIGDGEKGVKFYHRPWNNLFFDYGTKIWKGGFGEVAILKLLHENNITSPKIISSGFVSQKDWPFWRNLETERNPKAIVDAYLDKNNREMVIKPWESEDDIFAMEMQDFGKLSNPEDLVAAKKLYDQVRSLLLSHGIALTDASPERTIKQSDAGLVALDFGFVEATNEQGLKILLSELPDKNARNYCFHWQKKFGSL